VIRYVSKGVICERLIGALQKLSLMPNHSKITYLGIWINVDSMVSV
jgi:hypothetical protein